MIEFLERWAVQGRTPEGDAATTIFDLMLDRRRIMVYPATVDTFAVLIDGSAIHILADTLATQKACAVPALHAIHGPRLLCLRPYPLEPIRTDPAPMELSLTLPTREVHIIYRQDRLLALRTTLTQILDALATR